MSDAENKYFELSGPAFAKFVGNCELARIPLSDHLLILAKYAFADAYQDGVIAGLEMADAMLKARAGQ